MAVAEAVEEVLPRGGVLGENPGKSLGERVFRSPMSICCDCRDFAGDSVASSSSYLIIHVGIILRNNRLSFLCSLAYSNEYMHLV